MILRLPRFARNDENCLLFSFFIEVTFIINVVVRRSEAHLFYCNPKRIPQQILRQLTSISLTTNLKNFR